MKRSADGDVAPLRPLTRPVWRTIGYLLVGALHDAAGGWSAAIVALVVAGGVTAANCFGEPGVQVETPTGNGASTKVPSCSTLSTTHNDHFV